MSWITMITTYTDVLRMNPGQNCWRKNQWVINPNMLRKNLKKSISKYKNCCIWGNVPINFMIIIHRTWHMLKDWLQNTIFWKLRFSILILCWDIWLQNINHRLFLMQILRRITGRNVLKLLSTKILWLCLKRRTWRLILCSRMCIVKLVMFWVRCPSKTSREVTKQTSTRNLSRSWNLHTDRRLLTSSRQSTKTRRSTPTQETR